MSVPRISVVVATFNRAQLLARLLRQLAAQTLPPGDFEVVVVDDGSTRPAREGLAGLAFPYALRLEEQPNAGAAAARHRGALAARGALLLFTDDDMQVAPDFLAQHLARHPEGSRRVVTGPIRPDPEIRSRPLFERWYAHHARRLEQRLGGGERPRGNHLYTGNVSLRREDYLAVGGFDRTLGQSEDVELGLRLEAAGCQFDFAPEAFVLHGSDHTSFERWLARARRYGVFDARILRKHPERVEVSPWRLFFEMNVMARPFLATAVLAPGAGSALGRALLGCARLLDGFGLEPAAFAGTSVAYSLEYLRGASDEAGGLAQAVREIARYARRPGRTT